MKMGYDGSLWVEVGGAGYKWVEVERKWVGECGKKSVWEVG